MAEQCPDIGQIVALMFRMIATAADTVPAARRMIDKVTADWPRQQGLSPARSPNHLPVCDRIPDALRLARAAGPEISTMADAFEWLAPHLEWRPRENAADQGKDFLHGHANALIFGHGVYSMPRSVTLGVSLVAPNVAYPDHAHPPEELYIVLSSGEWRQNRGAWTRHGAGGLVHNPPGINHGMRAGEAPLLALWLLWNEKAFSA